MTTDHLLLLNPLKYNPARQFGFQARHSLLCLDHNLLVYLAGAMLVLQPSS